MRIALDTKNESKLDLLDKKEEEGRKPTPQPSDPVWNGTARLTALLDAPFWKGDVRLAPIDAV